MVIYLPMVALVANMEFHSWVAGIAARGLNPNLPAAVWVREGWVRADVVQQPYYVAGWVSTDRSVFTQFQIAAWYEVVGLLAHSWGMGWAIQLLEVGDEVKVVYGDGQYETYVVTLKEVGGPSFSPYTNAAPEGLVFQTCVGTDRYLFVTARLLVRRYSPVPDVQVQQVQEPSWMD